MCSFFVYEALTSPLSGMVLISSPRQVRSATGQLSQNCIKSKHQRWCSMVVTMRPKTIVSAPFFKILKRSSGILSPKVAICRTGKRDLTICVLSRISCEMIRRKRIHTLDCKEFSFLGFHSILFLMGEECYVFDRVHQV